MKILCLLIALLAALSAPVLAGEPKTASAEEIERLVQELSWDSIVGEHVALGWVPEAGGEVAEKLIRIGKPATPRLIQADRKSVV